MFRKVMLVLLLIVIFTIGLCAKERDFQKKDTKLKEMAIKFLKDNGFKEEMESKYCKIEVIPNDIKIIPYKNYKGYLIRFYCGNEWKSVRLLLKNNKFFRPFLDFNKILRNENIKIDSTNAIKILSTFLKLQTPYPKTLRIEKIHHVSIKLDSIWIKMGLQAFYNYEIYTYQKINGIKKKWLIGLKNGYIFIFQYEILDFHQGDYIKKDRLSPLKKKKLVQCF